MEMNHEYAGHEKHECAATLHRIVLGMPAYVPGNVVSALSGARRRPYGSGARQVDGGLHGNLPNGGGFHGAGLRPAHDDLRGVCGDV